MSSFPILDLVVGIIFIYFLLSIISSSAVELILTGLQVRSKVLEQWISTIFDSKFKKSDGTETTLGQEIMDHCAVTALSKKRRPPSYIDAKNFTSALIERITYDPGNPKSVAKNLDDIIAALNSTTVLSTELRRAFLSYAYEAKATYAITSLKIMSEIECFKAKIENWYDSSMDRLTGTLKTKYVRPFTLIVAAITAGVLNADSIAIAKYLYSNPEVRANLVERANHIANDTIYLNRINQIHASSQDSLTLQEVKNNIKKSVDNINQAKANLETNIPLGWSQKQLLNENGKYAVSLILTKVTGLLATILAIFMGAPFWFDVLNKIVNLRSTGPRPASSTRKDD